jgi:hypothetical protein
MDEKDVCCAECEERELDMLMATYAYIHLSEEEYISPDEIIDNVDADHEVKLNLSFVRSWIQKEWLEKNQFNRVTVPKPVRENIQAEGFSITSCLKQVLNRLKEHKPQYNPEILKDTRMDSLESQRRAGMVYMEKKRND